MRDTSRRPNNVIEEVAALRQDLDDLRSTLLFRTGRIGSFTSYEPTWTAATTDPSIVDGSLQGKFSNFGLVVVQFELIIGASTTLGTGDWFIGLPVAYEDSLGAEGAHLGSAIARDDSTGNRYNLELQRGDTELTFGARIDGGALSADSNSPFLWAVNDKLVGTLVYEVA